MIHTIFSRDKVHTGRQEEIDFVKFCSIIMMIVVHCIDELFDYENHLPSVIIDDILAQSVGAQAFMICMGIGIAFSKKKTAEDYFRRGVHLLVIGQLLNLMRYALPYGLAFVLSGDPEARAWAFLTFSDDILQFAGLFFLTVALLTMLKLRPLHIFLVAVAANLAGMAVCGHISTGLYPVDQLLGFFISTDTESYFPLFHWMIFPAFGMIFGDRLQYVKDKKRFYGTLFFPCAAVFALYYFVGLNIEQPYFRVFAVWQSLSYMNIFDAAAQLVCNTAVICLDFFIVTAFTQRAVQTVNFVSKNINRYYCVHSVMIYVAASICDYGIGSRMESAAVCYLTALAIIALTTLVVWFYEKYPGKRCRAYFGRHAFAWSAAVIVLSVLVCAWASHGVEEFPNLMNEYLG